MRLLKKNVNAKRFLEALMNRGTPKKNRPRIFFSYSSIDRKIVEKAHRTLINTHNLDIWRDQTRLETDWSREIAYALAESDVLCLMWSEGSATSKWVQHEWLTARALEKRIIPILFPDAPNLPEPLRNLHGIQLERSNTKALCKEVVNHLRESESFTEPYEQKKLPANSYVPFNPSPEFTGRHVDLLELYLKMVGNLNKLSINQVGTAGMGGVGKTQLAVEFAYRFSFAFDNVFWIQAGDIDQWRSEFVQLARDRLGLTIPDPDEPHADKRYIFRLHKYCKDNPQTLIIMDNVVEPKQLYNESHLYGLTPMTLSTNLLFTTRKNFRLNDVKNQTVDVLSPESAYTLLTHYRKPSTLEEEDHARAICNSIGYLPRAIILAAGYLNKCADVLFAEYHDGLSNYKMDVIDIDDLSEEEIAARHVISVSTTLKEDWSNINDENAKLILKLAGQFGESEIIPKARLGLLAGISSGKNKLNCPMDKAISFLHSLNLAEKIENDNRAIRLHPLVRDFSLRIVPVNEQPKFRSNAAKNLQSVYFDYSRLESEINARGVSEVLDDLRIAINWWGKDAQVLEELQLLQGTLRLSYNQLNHDPCQLAPHLVGRLMNINAPGIRKIIGEATESQNGAWLKPIFCSLVPPGGPLLTTYEGHSDSVSAVAISPDSQTVISGSSDHKLKVWDLSSGRVIKTLKGHCSGVTAIAISFDGHTAISGSYDYTLKLWDLSSGKALKTLKGHSYWVTGIAISPDGKTAVSSSDDKTLKVWDLTSGGVINTLDGHSDGVTGIAISPDGKTAVSSSDDKTLKVWDLSSGGVINTLKGHSDNVTGVAVSPDGKTAVSTSDDEIIKVWDLSSGKEIKSLQGHSHFVRTVAIGPDGKTAVSGSWDRTLKVWDLSTDSTKRFIHFVLTIYQSKRLRLARMGKKQYLAQMTKP